MRPNNTRFTIVSAIAAIALFVVPASALAMKGDRNRDRIPDRWEKRFGLSLKVDQRKRDQDRDGLRNLAEFRAGTSPKAVDTDRDGVDDTDEDRDNDSVDNGNEQRQGTRPNDRDTDNDRKLDAAEDRDRDGLNNGGEDASGNDPIDRDTDNDATEDGDEMAGTISAYDPLSGELTIIGFDGTSITALVDGSTRVACEDEDSEEASHDDDEDGNRRAVATRSDDESSGPDEDGSEPGEGPEDEEGEETEDDGDIEDGDDNRACPQDLLVVGARIHEAEILDPTATPMVWEEIEVLVPDTDDDTEVEASIGVISSFDAVSGTLVIAPHDPLASPISGTVNSSTEISCGSLYDEDAAEGVCGPADLTPGTLVHEAELFGGVYDEVELLR